MFYKLLEKYVKNKKASEISLAFIVFSFCELFIFYNPRK